MLTFPCIVGFIVGCGVGAVLEVRVGLWALALPVLLAVLAVALGEFSSGQPYDLKMQIPPGQRPFHEPSPKSL
jgi:uncharacterized membrane protein YoaK (UPF0700 family)